MKMRESVNQRENKGWYPISDNKLIVPLIQGFQNTLQASVNDLVVQSWCTSALVCVTKTSMDVYGRTVVDLAFGSVEHCSKRIKPFCAEETVLMEGRGEYLP